MVWVGRSFCSGNSCFQMCFVQRGVYWTNVTWVAVHLNMQGDANHYSFAGRCFPANVPVDMETDMIVVLSWAQHMFKN